MCPLVCLLVFPLTRSKDELCVSRDIARYYCQGEQLGNGDGSIMSQSQGSACGTECVRPLLLFVSWLQAWVRMGNIEKIQQIA